MLRLYIVGGLALLVAAMFATKAVNLSPAREARPVALSIYSLGPDGKPQRVDYGADGKVLTGADAVSPAVAAANAAQARLKGALADCADANGWSFEGGEPGRPSHFAASAFAYCHLTLPPELLCEPHARTSLIESLRTYFLERDRALSYLGQVDAARARRRTIVSSIDAEQRVAAEREAQSWVGDAEIADRLAKLVKAGYLRPDDFFLGSVHADVVQSLGGITPGDNACRATRP